MGRTKESFYLFLEEESERERKLNGEETRKAENTFLIKEINEKVDRNICDKSRTYKWGGIRRQFD